MLKNKSTQGKNRVGDFKKAITLGKGNEGKQKWRGTWSLRDKLDTGYDSN